MESFWMYIICIVLVTIVIIEEEPGEFAWFTSADESLFLSVSTLQLMLIIILVGTDY